MSAAAVPLSVVSNAFNTPPYAQIALGAQVYNQQSTNYNGQYWFFVIDSVSLKVVYNATQASASTAPNLGGFNTAQYILVVATLGVSFDQQPQGDLYNFLVANGAGAELTKIEQLAAQFGCGSLGCFGYVLVSPLGNQGQLGIEYSSFVGNNGPVVPLSLVPVTEDGQTFYAPTEIGD